MKKTLEDLWYSYKAENSPKHDERKKCLFKQLLIIEEKLQESLNDDQMSLLLSYEENLNGLCSISEKDAFIRGIQFATAYLIEALYHD